MRQDNQSKITATAIFNELKLKVRGLILPLQAIAVSMMLTAVQNTVLSGPTILQSAQPGLPAPLTAPRVPPAGSLGATPPEISNNTEIGGAAGSGFTIIGDQGTSGLQGAEDNDLTRTVRDELTGGAENQALSDPRENTGATAGESTGSTADIVRALVNSVPGEAAPGGESGGGQSASGGLIASVIDATVTDLVVTLLNPEQTTDGMVTFSIAGFGDFALLHLQENNSFFVVDLNGGTAIKFAQGDQPLRPSGTVQRTTGGAGGKEPPKQLGGKSNALQRVIAFLEDNILPFIQSPITLAALGLFSIIWIIWRLSAQA